MGLPQTGVEPRSPESVLMSLSRSYGRGILIVVCTLLASAVIALAGARSPSSPPRAAQDLGQASQGLGTFRLLERSGRTITDPDLADRVCITSFIFTRCRLSCPRITSVMKSLQDKLEGSNVLLLSLSVDPEYDMPQVLSEYASRFGADPDRWWFLTGDRAKIYELIHSRFRLSVMENPAPDQNGRTEAIAHSDRLALVDRGLVVGLFDSSDPSALEALVAQAKRSAMPAWVRTLPAVNASLNALCAILLIQGWIFIRKRRAAPSVGAEADRHGSLLADRGVRAHAVCMSLAVFTSGLFLTSYLVYHYHAGSMPFRATGALRSIYFTVLISHTLLATFGVVPLVTLTLLRAYRRDFAGHRMIAATTFPIWVYVSITGVAIYFMLYHLPAITLALLVSGRP